MTGKTKLWLLEPREELGTVWDPWWDKAFGFVVRASSEEEARKMAAEECGNETTLAWLDNKNSTCVELTSDGGVGVIIQDFHAA